ncbi:MAG: methionyl-tRNA formyltransferase [Candidatus Komeilibacteria bacterium]
MSLIFWGTPEIAVPTLKALAAKKLISAVVTRPDAPAGRGKKINSSLIKQLAAELALPILTPIKLDEGFITELKKFLPATFLIFAYGKIIPPAILDLSEQPAINVHPSKLPELRGASPIQTALLTGLKQTAVTLMQLDARMDHGPILAQIPVEINDNDYFADLYQKAATISAHMMVDTIPQYLAGQLKPVEQNHNQATVCKKINMADGKLDWNEPAETVRNKIRAFTPWPSAYFFWNNKRFQIVKADVADNSNKKPSGTWWTENNQLFVACGQDALSITLIKPEGKKEMTGKEFVNGYKIAGSL